MASFSLPLNTKLPEDFVVNQFIPFLSEHKEYIYDIYTPGPRKHDARDMLKQLGYASLDELTDTAVPDDIKLNRSAESILELQTVSQSRRRSLLGMPMQSS